MSGWKLRIIQMIARRLPPCDVITHQLSESLDGRLSLRERIVLRVHLLVCVWCTRYSHQIAFVKHQVRETAVAAESEAAPEARLSSEARDRIKRALTSPPS